MSDIAMNFKTTVAPDEAKQAKQSTLDFAPVPSWDGEEHILTCSFNPTTWFTRRMVSPTEIGGFAGKLKFLILIWSLLLPIRPAWKRTCYSHLSNANFRGARREKTDTCLVKYKIVAKGEI